MSNFRIRVLYAFLSVGPDGDEGVAAFIAPHGWMPMVAANEERLTQLRPIAQQLATLSGQMIRLVRFEDRIPVEEIQP